MKKLRVAVLFGGKSGEHEVSLLSAASVLNAIDRTKYDVILIGIGKDGRWLTGESGKALLEGRLAPQKELGIGAELAHNPASGLIADVVFPVLHGPSARTAPYRDYLSWRTSPMSARACLAPPPAWTKDAAKRLFAAAGLPIPKHVTLLRSVWRANAKKCTALIEKSLRYPIFVKPANLGSSVGISKVRERSELAAAMDLAAEFDRKLVIEEGVGGKNGRARELEVAVLGNDAPEASVVGEIVPGKDFYDYEDKYLSAGSVPIIPAKLTATQSKQIREMALAAFKACECSGLARVDFLMEPARNGKAGAHLSKRDQYDARLHRHQHVSQTVGGERSAVCKVIDKLIELARERHAEKQQTIFSRD